MNSASPAFRAPSATEQIRTPRIRADFHGSKQGADPHESVAGFAYRASLDRTAEGGRPHVVLAEVRCPRSGAGLLQHTIVKLLSSPVGGCLHKCLHQGVRLVRFGRKLRLE